MTTWSFSLIIGGIDLTDDELDALYEAGCDDATFAVEVDGTVLAMFDRTAPTEVDAVVSAITDVRAAVTGARVLRVQADDDWLTASEIAERVGRSRESIRLLVRGLRGPGDFPRPVARAGSPNPLWSWSEVEAWFEGYEPGSVPHHTPRLSPDFLGELNDLLDLFERRWRVPDAPWRPKLAQVLPLGA